jgi:hypothetical protein
MLGKVGNWTHHVLLFDNVDNISHDNVPMDMCCTEKHDHLCHQHELLAQDSHSLFLQLQDYEEVSMDVLQPYHHQH